MNLTPPSLVGKGGGGLGFLIFRRDVKHNLEGYIWHQAFQDLHMCFCIAAAAKPCNDSHLHSGDGTDDAPGIEPISIGHNEFNSLSFGAGASAVILVRVVRWLSAFYKLAHK